MFNIILFATSDAINQRDTHLLCFSAKKQSEFKGDFDFPLEKPLETSRVTTLHPGENERRLLTMGTTKTTWWDKENNQHEGYIKDGITYVDEAGTARVPVGATVKTNGGTYKMTSSGGVPTAATVRNQYQANTNAAINAYEAAGEVQKERINSATNAAVAELNRQKRIAETNRQDADRAAREAYLKAANPFGALEEQRVRLGLDNSGYAESSKLRLASDYAAQAVQNLRTMNEQLQSLDIQIAQAKASGQYELANMLEARAQNVMQQKVAMENNLSSLDMQAISQAESARQWEEDMAYQAARDAILDERYKTEWDYGVEQDKKAEEWKQREWDYQVAQAAKASGTVKKEKPTLTYDQMMDAIYDGEITPGVEAAYLYYHKKPYGTLNIDDFTDEQLNSLAELGAIEGDEAGNLYWSKGWNDDNWGAKWFKSITPKNIGFGLIR